MNELSIFNYGGREVRTVIVNGDPWWVAKDVCDVLGIANHSDALSGIRANEKDEVGITDPIGREQGMTVINEPSDRALRRGGRAECPPRYVRRVGRVRPCEPVTILPAKRQWKTRGQR